MTDVGRSRLWQLVFAVGLLIIWGAIVYEAGLATATSFALLLFLRMKALGDAAGSAIIAAEAATAAAAQLAAVQRERVEELVELRQLRERLGIPKPPDTPRSDH